MEKTIVILSHVSFDASPYCSYVHSHAISLQELGYKVIVLAPLNYFPLITLFRKNRKEIYKDRKGKKIIDKIEVIYKKKLSFSTLLKNSKFNINGFFYYLAIKNTFKKITKTNEVILIDAHTYKVEGYAAFKLKKKYGIKTFITCHGTSFNNYFQSDTLKLDIIKRSKIIDYYVGVSNKIINQLNSLGIKNTKLIYNGTNFFNLENNVSKDKFKIVTIGSFTSDKNIDVVIKSFKKINEKYKKATLTIVGTGPLELKLKELADNNKNIIFTGYLPNEKVHEILQTANIFVLVSSPEGFGISYLEAMYNKCITIGTLGEGIDGFIKNQENGFLININEAQLVDLIKNIFEEKYNLDLIRKNAFASVRDLTWKRNALEYIKLVGDKK